MIDKYIARYNKLLADKITLSHKLNNLKRDQSNIELKKEITTLYADLVENREMFEEEILTLSQEDQDKIRSYARGN